MDPGAVSVNQKEDETLESLHMGRGNILQKRKGYRFSIDALILADFLASRQASARNRKNVRYADLGTGSGIIPIMLSKWKNDFTGYGVEIQEALADMAERNIRLHHLEDRFKILHMNLVDLTDRFPGRSFDWITINPPYRRLQTGRINPNMEKALARHEISVTLEEICRVMAALLRVKGKAYVIYPADRFAELVSQLHQSGLEPKCIKPVYPKPGEKAVWILVEAACGGRPGLICENPLWVEDEEGKYSAQIEQMFLWKFDAWPDPSSDY